jgi:hypothetical protein
LKALEKEVAEAKMFTSAQPFKFVVERLEKPATPTFRWVDSMWSNVGTSVYKVKLLPNLLKTPPQWTFGAINRCLDVCSEPQFNSSITLEGRNELRNEILAIIEKTVAEALERWGQKLASTENATLSSAVASSDPLAAARARGVAYMKAQLELPENLNLDAAAKYAGLSGRHINELRQRGELYALVLDGHTRGFRYPQWQFDAQFQRLARLIKMLNQKAVSCWAIHDFLTRSNDDLGRSPKDAILDAGFPLERIEQAIEKRFGSADQGAV